MCIKWLSKYSFIIKKVRHNMFNDRRMINYEIVVAQIIVLPFNIT